MAWASGFLCSLAGRFSRSPGCGQAVGVAGGPKPPLHVGQGSLGEIRPDVAQQRQPVGKAPPGLGDHLSQDADAGGDHLSLDADAGVVPAGRSGAEGPDADPVLPVEVGDLAVLLDLGAEEGPGLQNPVLLGGAQLSGKRLGPSSRHWAARSFRNLRSRPEIKCQGSVTSDGWHQNVGKCTRRRVPGTVCPPTVAWGRRPRPGHSFAARSCRRGK
uniref:PRO2325 n=1 Tax=Homo sapiens TaxID=9606 RepID=Q9P170_HUMAN|nr:PRO2325 [Homo sapiens]